MKKIFLVVFIIIFGFSGCFSFFENSLEKSQTKKTILPKNAPLWVYNPKVIGNIGQIGIAKNLKSGDFSFYRELALINATQNLTKKIYIKSNKILSDYYKKAQELKVFERDIKQQAKQIALKSVQKVKVINSFKSDENMLFVHIIVDSNEVLKHIQDAAKELFKPNQIFTNYFFLEARQKELIKELEN